MSSNLIKAIAISLQTCSPTILWGSPGNGKTATMTAIAKSFGIHLETVMASLSDPSDFAGLAVADYDEKDVKMLPKSWAVRLSNMKEALLFFDEINTAPPSVQAVLLRVVLQRIVGDLQLPDSIFIAAAANPPTESAGGWDLAPPLANRFVHFDWEVGFSDWCDGMLSGFSTFNVEKLPLGWQKSIPVAKAMIIGFLRTSPNLVHVIPKDDTASSKGWPSHRSWDMASRLLGAAIASDSNKSIKNLLVTGAVGSGPAMQFSTYCERMDLPDPEDILANPEGFNMPSALDYQHVILSSIVAAVLGSEITAKRWNAAWIVIAKVVNSGKVDIAVPSARLLYNAAVSKSRSGSGNMATLSKEILESLRTLLPTIQKAGLTIS